MCDICAYSIMSTDLDTILKSVSDISGYSIEALKSKRRFRDLVDSRFAYFILAKELTDTSLSEIGSKVCKDHVTVLNGLKSKHIKNVINKVNTVRVLYYKTNL